MSSKSKTLDAELMDPGMTGNVTPAKKGSERENDMTQQEKKHKLTIHEKPPTETSQQLINVPGNEVEQPKAVRGDDTSSEIVKEGPEEGPGYCMIHDCNADDHSTFTYPDREKYLTSGKLKASDLELMVACRSGNLTPAKRGSEPENDLIQPEKQPKLTENEVEEPKTVRGDDTSSEIVKEGPKKVQAYCEIHDYNTDDHDTFTCPDREKYMMPGKSKTSDLELMVAGMSGNLTPAKCGSEPENDSIQPEKQPKLTENEVEEPKTVRGDDTSSEIVKEEGPKKGRAYCEIHDYNTDDHDSFTCPLREKYTVFYNGHYVLNFCDLCGLGHLGINCPLGSDDFNYD